MIKKTNVKVIAENKWAKLKELYFDCDGKKVGPYLIMEQPGGAVIFPVTKDNKVIFFKEYYPLIEKELISLPAGFTEKDESPEEGARRELFEETGYKAGEMIDLGGYYPLAKRDTVNHKTFLAKDCEFVGKPKNEDPLENYQEIVLYDLDEVKELLSNENIEAGIILTMVRALRKLGKI